MHNIANIFENADNDANDIRVEPEKPTENPGLGGSTKIALYVGLTFFAAFALFAAFAPISGGAIASGVISPEGRRKVVQHLEGGIIDRIIVREGEIVKANDPLLVLNETQALAERNIAFSRYKTFSAILARLEAEQFSEETVTFPFTQEELADPRIASVVRRQENLLKQSLELKSAREGLLDERIAQLYAEIEGLEASILALRQQEILLREEMAGVRTLIEKGVYHAKTPRLIGLEREQAAALGQISTSQSTIARLRGQISELRVQKLETEAQRQSDLATQLAEIRAELDAAEERLIAAEDILSRTVVKSPIDGRVVNLRFTTNGGVVGSGQEIVDIVPSDERLIIEARVKPTDIDIIAAGQQATVTFSALGQSGIPQIKGDVLTVSADTFSDERTGETYFLAEIEVPPETLQDVGISGKLTPGMPVDVMIATNSRTLLQYISQPLSGTFRKAFREDN